MASLVQFTLNQVEAENIATEKNIIIFFDILQIDDVSTTTIKKNKIHSISLKDSGKIQKDQIHNDLVSFDMLLDNIKSFTVLSKILQTSQQKNMMNPFWKTIN